MLLAVKLFGFVVLISLILEYKCANGADVNSTGTTSTISNSPISSTPTAISNSSTMDDAKFQEIMVKCNQSHPIQMEYLKEFNSTGSFPDETDKEPMCYMKCYLENVDIISGDGKMWNKQRLIEMMPSITDDAIDACSEEQDGLFDDTPNEQCATVYYMMRCLMTKVLMISRNGDEV